jgi:hypothetical protein
MRTSIFKVSWLTILVVTLMSLNAASIVAADTDDDQRALIAPIRTRPEGQTYGRWGR